MRLFKLLIWGLIGILSLYPGICAQAAEAQEPPTAALSFYEDGDVVGFVGDSITHAEYCSINYVEALNLYYLSRFPDREVEFRNLGASGYKIKDILRIYDQDPAFRGINKAVIMLGTNEAILSTPATDYISDMEQLVTRLKANGLRGENILIMTPPICDENFAASSYWKFEGRLLEYIQALEPKTAEWGVQYLDIHAPMVELTEEIRKENSRNTLTTGDAIHPSANGQQLIAYYILQAQGAGSETMPTIAPPQETGGEQNGTDGAAGTGWEEFTDYYRGDRGLFWTLETEVLPFAATKELVDFLGFYEPAVDLYQERLQVEGLTEDTVYRVLMGDAELGSYTGAELGRGIDLAMLATHPQYPIVQQIEERSSSWHVAVEKHRVMWIDVMMQRATFTEQQIQERYASWRATDETLRSEMHHLARDAADAVYRMIIVEEGYSASELEQEAERERIEAEQARQEAEEQARKEAEELARREAEEKAKKEAEELARKEAEEQARKEAAEAAKREFYQQITLASVTVVVLMLSLAICVQKYKRKRR